MALRERGLLVDGQGVGVGKLTISGNFVFQFCQRHIRLTPALRWYDIAVSSSAIVDHRENTADFAELTLTYHDCLYFVQRFWLPDCNAIGQNREIKILQHD